ncbi:hypothetical protein [Streptosporangium sp. NPDC006007]|uniref:hypothetical protein n=1 Tax=Streptosporangium sp. NPDC006007 TaxID=3154575 RepID=UPI0033AA85AD
MSRLFTPGLVALCGLNLLYVLADLLPPGTRVPHSTQEFMLAAALAVTAAWLVRHHSIGYRHGHDDAERDRP